MAPTRYDLRLDPSKNAPLNYNKSHIDYFGFGNHDVGYNSGQAARDNYSMPIPVEGVTSPVGLLFDSNVQEEENYSFDYGSVHFVTFDSNNWQDTASLDKQLNWAVADIQAARARATPPQWVIVFVHHPITSLGGHTEHTPDDYYYDQVISRLGHNAGGVGVDLLLAGHTHNYQRSMPLTGHTGATATYVLDTDSDYAKGAGLPLVVQGTGGVELGYGNTDATFANTYLAKAIDSNTTVPEEFGFGKVDVTATQLTYSYINTLGQVLDTFTITAGGDVKAPVASLASPLDNGPVDGDPLVNQALVDTPLATIQIRLSDIGGGVDDSTVTSGLFSLTREGTPLLAGIHFSYAYDAANNLITLTALGTSFGYGTYVVSIGSGIEDLAGNVMGPTALTVEVDATPLSTITFRNGENGYTGAKDTYLHEDEPSTTHGSSSKVISDGDDDLGTAEAPPQRVQGLVRFDAMFDTTSGSRGGGPIPDGTTILNATLTVKTGTSSGDESPSGNVFSLHRMIATWSEFATWDTMTSGVTLDNVEAVSTATATVNGPSVQGGTVSFDVTADVQIWSNDNSLALRGWVFQPTTGTNGWQFFSSNTTTIADRPILSVTFQDGPSEVFAGAAYVTNEGDGVSLVGSAFGSGLTYSWDLNGDDVFGDAVGATPTLTWAQLVALGLNDGASTHVVTLRVSDGLGNEAEDTTWLTFQNVAPTASVGSELQIGRGVDASFTLSAVDPSSADNAAGFTFDIDWDNNGIFDQTVFGLTGTVVTHAFDGLGSATIRVRATDKDGGVSMSSTWSTNVVGYEVLGGNLIWYGTSGADEVQFEQLDATTIRVTETLLAGVIVSNSWDVINVTGQLQAFTHAGGDAVDGSLVTTISILARGGAGDDTLRGGQAADEIDGEADNDLAFGDLGDDVVDGGSGDDILYGDLSDALAASLSYSVLGSDSVYGGVGDDTLYGDGDGGEGVGDLIEGDDGEDTIFGDGAEGHGNAADTIHGGADDDTIYGDGVGSVGAADLIFGDAGNDTIVADGSKGKKTANDTIYGGSGDDSIKADGGEGAADQIHGEAGNDLIDTGGGNDLADGGADDDILLGGDGAEGAADTLLGGDGRDFLVGDRGTPTVKSTAAAADSLVGGFGEDIILAGIYLPFNSLSVQAIHSEWVSSRTYSERVANISGTGVGARNNGSDFLEIGTTVTNDHVAPPAVVDSAFGEEDQDWLLIDLADDLNDATLGEVVTDL
ncbi:MAG: DNRLRE domain-containing protein [Planctomycetota bacterium]